MNELILCPVGSALIEDLRGYRKFYNSKNGYWYLEFYHPKRVIAIHRFLTGAFPGDYVDHINGNKCDNRIINLRFCSKAENTLNRPKRKGTKCRYKGVTKNTGAETYTARACRKYLGSFKTQEEAARAYDAYMLTHHPDFAVLNFPKNHY